MTNQQLTTDFNQMLYAYGMPFRIKNARGFNLRDQLKTYTVGEEKIVNTAKQHENFNIACRDASGWMMYVCAATILDRAKLVAANVMQCYQQRGLKCLWLSHLDNLKREQFASVKLVVIDALFFDSSPYRRDKVYEVINYYCNMPDMSVLVIGQNTDPIAMATQLGMRPNLAMCMK